MDGGVLILAIFVTIVVFVLVWLPSIVTWFQDFFAKKEQEKEVAEQAASQPHEAPVARHTASYLGNLNTKEIHDLSNTQPRCHIERISEKNKIYFDTFEAAKKAMETAGYNGCRWCLSAYDTDR